MLSLCRASFRSARVLAALACSTVSLLVTLAPSTCHAAEAPIARAPAKPTDPLWARPLAFDVHGGVGTPLGFGGLSLDIAPARWFVLSGGLGAGKGGMQEAAMARFRAPMGHFAFSLGGGMSTGAYDAADPFGDSNWHWKRAFWANGEASIEFRDHTGVELRAYVGWAHLANAVADGCETGNGRTCSNAAGGLFATSFPYAGFAAGYAFDL
jgi:uncharacterized protein YfiM (DUF2279 family)